MKLGTSLGFPMLVAGNLSANQKSRSLSTLACNYHVTQNDNIMAFLQKFFNSNKRRQNNSKSSYNDTRIE